MLFLFSSFTLFAYVLNLVKGWAGGWLCAVIITYLCSFICCVWVFNLSPSQPATVISEKNSLVLWHLVDSAPLACLFVHKQNSLSKTSNCFSFSGRQRISALFDLQSRSLPHREARTLIASVTATILIVKDHLEDQTKVVAT